jgi:hypothetical protein
MISPSVTLSRWCSMTRRGAVSGGKRLLFTGTGGLGLSRLPCFTQSRLLLPLVSPSREIGNGSFNIISNTNSTLLNFSNWQLEFFYGESILVYIFLFGGHILYWFIYCIFLNW